MKQPDRLMQGTTAIVRIAWIANRLFLSAVIAGLAATWLVPGFFGRLLAESDPSVDIPAALSGARLLLLVGIAMAIATDRLLVALTKIIATARSGDPFVLANAERLRTIGWALLALQLLDIPGILLARFWPSLGAAAPDGGVSVGGWIATLMVFMLARIFATGAAMRDDLAGTV